MSLPLNKNQPPVLDQSGQPAIYATAGPPGLYRPSVVRPRRRKLLWLIGLLLFWAVLIMVALHERDITDWWRLRHFQPSATVSELASETTMTPYARKVFYVNSPVIADKTSFSHSCPANGGEKTVILGCYHSNQAGIYVLGVTDSRLTGVEQVTAAHETLHAAYDRLSGHDRQRVDAMLQDYYQHDLKDARLLDTIAAYKKSEPHDVVNEMHSVFGTEAANLPAPLEQYYRRYFTNRSQIVDYAQRYQGEFTTRQAQVKQADSQLQNLKQQIERAEADLQSQQATISAQQSALLQKRNSGQTAAYNAGVPVYNQLVDSYNGQVQAVHNLIDQYNQLVANRNAIALEEDQLANALNPSAQPIQK